ncbi:MAG: hypothetical protein ACK4QW_09245 [Alphaproteobacteria bacterium]
MLNRIAFAAGCAALSVMIAAAPAAASTGKYCAVYQGDAVTITAALSWAKVDDCRQRAIRVGGDGWGLGCQSGNEEPIATPKTPTDTEEPVDATAWPTEDEKIKEACSREWGRK